MRPHLPDTHLYTFSDHTLVVCPHCQGSAQVRMVEAARTPQARLTCTHCGYNRFDRAQRVLGEPLRWQAGAPVDTWFRMPLWLQTPCCGHVLWALNHDHLAWLEDYVAATDRGQTSGNSSLRSRLPLWMKSAKHRDEVLRGVRRLRAL